MRKFYKSILQEKFLKYLYQYRNDSGDTFEKIAEKLVIEPRSLYDINSGKNSCSGLTLALFLIYCCTDPIEFLHELKFAFEEKAYDNYAKDAISYRHKMQIKENVLYTEDDNLYPLCPRCSKVMDREYLRYCSGCGQKLSWINWDKSPIVKQSEPEKI